MSRLDTGFDTKSLELRHEIKKLQSELREAAEENRKLENALGSTKEEVSVASLSISRCCFEKQELDRRWASCKTRFVVSAKKDST